MSHTNTNIPNPPYTYNDPRITYNEKCFFYNGGFDLQCLVVRKPVGVSGVAVGRLPQKSFPSKEVIDMVFKVCIEYVNDKQFKDEEVCEIKKYVFQKENNVTVKTSDLKVKRKIIKITSDDFSVKVLEKFLSSSNPTKKDINNNTQISSSFEKLKTYVSSSLHFKSPKKINVNSSIFKKKSKTEE